MDRYYLAAPNRLIHDKITYLQGVMSCIELLLLRTERFSASGVLNYLVIALVQLTQFYTFVKHIKFVCLRQLWQINKICIAVWTVSRTTAPDIRPNF